MKTKIRFGFLVLGTLLSSCYTEVIVEDETVAQPVFVTNNVLQSYDLWYVDINATKGNGEVPFLQRAFTLSFVDGTVFANNNIVGIGKTGNGFGIDVGIYNTFRGVVEIDHDVDGLWVLDVFLVNDNTIELHDPSSNTSYYLRGSQTHTFDYDTLFYDNINYLLQEYDVWEKTFTSEEGALNEFDNESFLQFFPNSFRSSIDGIGTPISHLQWDFEGAYQVYDVANDRTLKTLALSYDFMGDDYFELYVINDRTIELYHPISKTVYQFRGRGYQQYLKSGKNSTTRKRKKSSNPIMKVQRKRK